MHRRQRIRSYPKSRLDRYGTGFKWRMRVPDDVFKLYGRRYFIVTLPDTSHSQAQKESAKLDAQHFELIEKLRKAPANERTALVAGGGAKPLAKQVDASDVNPEQEGNVAYFGDLIDQWNRKGANVALHFPITPEVNVRAIPRTRLWALQKQFSMSAIVEWMSLVLERGSIKHDGGHYALWHENGKPTDTAFLPEVMFASAQEFAQRRGERHVKQADVFDVWQACGGRTEVRPGQSRVRDVVIGYQDGMVPRPNCYAPIDRGEMSSRFATRWHVQTGNDGQLEASSAGNATPAVAPMREADVRRFAAWMLNVPEDEITRDMLERSQMAEAPPIIFERD